MQSSYCTTLYFYFMALTLKKYRNTEIQKHKMQSRYCTALYFCFTALISVGFGNVAPNTDAEKLYAIVMMLLGCESSHPQVSHVLGGLQKTNFWSSPLMCRQPPPTCGTTISLYLFVVVVNQLHTTQVQSMML